MGEAVQAPLRPCRHDCPNGYTWPQQPQDAPKAAVRGQYLVATLRAACAASSGGQSLAMNNSIAITIASSRPFFAG